MNDKGRKPKQENGFRVPGVYVSEPPSPRAIAGVRTDVPAFVGYTERAETGQDSDAAPVRLARIGSVAEYEAVFGGPVAEPLAVTVTRAPTLQVALASPPPDAPRFLVAYAVRMFFANGGDACWVVSVGRHGVDGAGAEVREADLMAGIRALADRPEPALVVVPDACALDPDPFGRVVGEALSRAAEPPHRFTIVDVPRAVPGDVESDDDVSRELRDRLSGHGSALRFGASYFPYLRTEIPLHWTDGSVTVVGPGPRRARGRGSAATERPRPLERLRHEDTRTYAAVREFLEGCRATLPPSGAVAGAIARVDRTRGVWKAPANVALHGVERPALAVTAALNERLNAHPSGMAVNAIRRFAGKGTLVWGARTLATSDPELRYVPVRRMLLFLETSIHAGLAWSVFEPNGPNVWRAVRTAVEQFLHELWRAGAFAGRTTDEAFFVKVGQGETMTEADVAAGRLKVQIGVAAMRPAEFIVIAIERMLSKRDEEDGEDGN